MPDLSSIPSLEVHRIAARQVFLVLDVGLSALGATHVAAGQYVKAAVFDNDVPRPFALCNRPHTGTFELLIKAPDEGLAALLALQPGHRLAVGPAQGKGFPVALARGGDLWLFAVGSGIGPLKAVIDVVLQDRTAFREVVVVYGVRDAAELAFRERFGSWAGQGIRVVPVVSRPDVQTWMGKVGHVQSQLPDRFAQPKLTTAFVCGLPEMEKAVAQALLERGIGPDQVYRNW